VFIKSDRVGITGSVSNQSISGMLARFTGASEATSLTWLLFALAAAVLGLGIAAWVRRRGHELLAVTLVGMTATVVSPFSWEHHWVWFVPLLVFLVHTALVTRGRAIRRATLWVAGVIYALTFGWIVTFPHPWTWRLPEQGLFKLASWPWLEVVTRNTFLLVFVISLVYSVVIGRTAPTTESRPRETELTFAN
jgi:alpha-1,2-mannosyltransferase